MLAGWINATIQVVDASSNYGDVLEEVRMDFLPHAGDYIDLSRFYSQTGQGNPGRRGVVIAIVHDFRDIPTEVEIPQHYHFVTIFVRETESPYFQAPL